MRFFRLRGFVLRVKSNKPLLGVLLAGVALRFLAAPFTGHWYDMGQLERLCEWSYSLMINPLLIWGYGPLLPPFPLASYPLHLVMSSLGLGSILTVQLAIKVPSILADVGIGLLLYELVSEYAQSGEASLLAAASWVFNPFAVFVSGVYGQLDSIPTLFLLLALLLVVKGRYVEGFAMLSVSACMKYFAFTLFPIFALYSWNRMTRREKVRSLLASMAIIGVSFLHTPDNFYYLVGAGAIHGPLGPRFGYASTLSIWDSLRAVGVLGFIPEIALPYLFPLSFGPSYALTTMYVYRKSHKSGLGEFDVLRYSTVTLLLILPFTPNVQERYLLWALPLLFCASFVSSRQLEVITHSLWALSLTTAFIRRDPCFYLYNLYLEYAPVRGYLFGPVGLLTHYWPFLILLAISWLLGLGSSLRRVCSGKGKHLRSILSKSVPLVLSCTLVLTLLFLGMVGARVLGPLPAHCAWRERVNRWTISPAEVETSASQEPFIEYRFRFDLRFMSERAWDIAYASVNFTNLLPSSRITIDGVVLPNLGCNQGMVELSDPRDVLRRDTVLRIHVPQTQAEFVGLTNGGFEEGLDGWVVRQPSHASVDVEVKNGGNSSLRIRRPEVEGWTYVRQMVPVVGGMIYNVSFWMRVENVCDAHFEIECYDEDGRFLDTVLLQKSVSGTKDWWRIQKNIRAPENTAYAVLSCAGGSSLSEGAPGVTWLDDVEVVIPEVEAHIIFGLNMDEAKPWWRENLPIVLLILASDMVCGLLLIAKPRHQWLHQIKTEGK